jgi:SNF2 family DNA or RNA helicase
MSAALPLPLAAVPQERPAQARTYGTLRLTEAGTGGTRGARWEIDDLEPHVAIRFKHLFPRVPKNSAGPFHLPNDLMHAADLEWFTLRYPLAMTAEDRHVLETGRRGWNREQAELERILLPDYRAPAIDGVRPGQRIRDYQAQAIEVLRRRKSLLLGDEGGLGKTYTAAGFLASTPGALPAAVVCDAHMQQQWADKITAFTALSAHLIKKGSPYNLPPADVYIFRVSQIGGWIQFFKSHGDFFNTAVYDEPQSLRTGKGTQKGAAAFLLSQGVTYRLGLTATPIYNYGIEMWNVMQFIDDAVLGEWADFEREWVLRTASLGQAGGRIKDPKALGTYLREQHALIRRLKSDVGQQLPKTSIIVETIDYDVKTVESVEALAQQLAIRATTGSFIERGQAARELDIMVRQATGIAKAKAVATFARLMVEAGEPVLLVGWHREVYRIWLEALADLKPAMYTGSESAARKEAEKRRFLDGGTDILILSLRSGAGVDGLQHRSSVVILGELDWSPGIHQQILWRLDREGQKNPVTCFLLVTDDGSDPPMMDVLGIKKSEATQIVDPHLGVQIAESDESHLRRLVDRYLVKTRAKEPSNERDALVPLSAAADHR